MSLSLRNSEKWFNRGLWFIALIFAGFLIGLGSLVVGDLPHAEKQLLVEDFIDGVSMKQIDQKKLVKEAELKPLNEQKNQLIHQLELDSQEKEKMQESFNRWLETRSVTERSSDNPEVIQRAKALDQFTVKEKEIALKLEPLDRKIDQFKDALTKLDEQKEKLRDKAYEELMIQQKKQDIRIFLYRLLFTLPLLILSAWLFIKKRKNNYWPFVYGFIIFSLFAFFVELVPYLPSYGGYVRYVVGLILTGIIGHYAIKSLQKYLERLRQQESLPVSERQIELSHDVIMARLLKKSCPSCERSVDMSDANKNFCPHCGLSLFNLCTECHIRKSSFDHFCFSCGADAKRVVLTTSQPNK